MSLDLPPEMQTALSQLMVKKQRLANTEAAFNFVTVTCTRCGTTYEGISPGQAMDCATTLTEQGHVVGHYGSRVFDLHQGRVTGEATKLASGTLCDSCVTALRMAGEIVDVGETTPRGA